MIADNKLKQYIMTGLKLQPTPTTRKLVEMIVKREFRYNKQYWLDKHDQELDALRFVENGQFVLSEFIDRFRGLLREDVLPGTSLNTIQCKVNEVQGKVKLLIDIDASKFIK